LEAALVLPICLIFILGIFEYARYVMFLQLFSNAAREGVRYAVTHLDPVTIQNVTYGNSTSDVTNVINQYLAGQQLASQQIQLYESDSLGNNLGPWQNAQAGDCLCVRITGNYPLISPKLVYASATLPIQAQAVMRVESY
jgi:Flp pilus assembly protein TadG